MDQILGRLNPCCIDARDCTMVVDSFDPSRWSSVTSLLLGICLDRGLIRSLDEPAEAYVPELKGTYHGSVTVRNLANMSSGADVVHCRDNPTIYPCAFWGPGAEVGRTVAGWNNQREAQGTQFNYTELSALAIGMLIRAVSGQTMAAFAQVVWLSFSRRLAPSHTFSRLLSPSLTFSA